MNYQMEELVPLVGKLAEKYTAGESSSVTYETAEQLMGAVLYCIQELEQSDLHAVEPAEPLSAEKAYAIGMEWVEKKARETIHRYREISTDFVSYGNVCLSDTFLKGIPEFFRRYDMRFAPQNTNITLDYPVLADLSGCTGIDKIYAFLQCIDLEQQFLGKFPEDFVREILRRYHPDYEELIENLCEVVLTFVTGRMLARRSITEESLEPEDYSRVFACLHQTEQEQLYEQAQEKMKEVLHFYYGDTGELAAYLNKALPGICVRLQAVQEAETLAGLF